MSRTIHTITDPVYLHFYGIEEELDAIWVIEVETWIGEDGFPESEMTARLLSWHRHGQEGRRSDAVEIGGEVEIARQEEITAECFDPELITLPMAAE